ncbi:MAG: hypothetical protein EZS28_004180 [Streblomastix strix]|uniref:Uncharacterized protein n=1 Tax=Streblomastix strix TaxID=222440 RepID=A0A5J4WZL9_9EUKA|nr:MAG: hypothetical protein EZS28_004180 [Streblomastix strix]
MKQNEKFPNMMCSMVNKLQNHSGEDKARRLRIEILNMLSPEEQQRVKRGLGPQMRLTSFYESQLQSKIAEQNSNLSHIDTGWDFGSGTGEQQDEFKEDFVDKSHWMATDQSNRKLRSRLPTSKRQRIAPLTQTNPHSQTTPYPNQNQSSILNVDLMRIISNPFSVPNGIQHQQIVGKAAKVYHAPRVTFSTNGNVRKLESSTNSIVSGQVGVAKTKPTNIQTALSTQLQRNPIRELKVEKKESMTPVRGVATSTNTSVIANQNQSEDLQR